MGGVEEWGGLHLGLDGVTWLETMFFEGLDKVNISVDDLLCIHLSPTTALGNLSAASRTSAGLPPTPVGASAPTTATAVPKPDVPGDGPPLSVGDGLPKASHSYTNVCLSGSGQATSSQHPLFPAECDFEYEPDGEGNAYARSPRAHQPYAGAYDYRNAAAHP